MYKIEIHVLYLDIAKPKYKDHHLGYQQVVSVHRLKFIKEHTNVKNIVVFRSWWSLFGRGLYNSSDSNLNIWECRFRDFNIVLQLTALNARKHINNKFCVRQIHVYIKND